VTFLINYFVFCINILSSILSKFENIAMHLCQLMSSYKMYYSKIIEKNRIFCYSLNYSCNKIYINSSDVKFIFNLIQYQLIREIEYINIIVHININ